MARKRRKRRSTKKRVNGMPRTKRSYGGVLRTHCYILAAARRGLPMFDDLGAGRPPYEVGVGYCTTSGGWAKAVETVIRRGWLSPKTHTITPLGHGFLIKARDCGFKHEPLQ